jgi:pantoate--beta-alanine ligase
MNTKIIRTISEMRKISSNWPTSVGFVPTMGFLHEGHLSLIKTAQKDNETTVVSIYVNPAQFGPQEDLSEYPRDLEKDIELLAELNVGYVFLPDDGEMYPKNFKTWIQVEDITEIMCGIARPTHFKGVTTIVNKLLNIVRPDTIYLGEKDFQQLIVLKTMVRDLNMTCEVKGCPIVRESDGLAMSSRNIYLKGEDRDKALCLYKSLLLAQKLFSEGVKDPELLRSQMEDIITQNGGVIDYIAFIDAESLKVVDELHKGCRIALAVKISGTRLIDNLQI